MSIILLILELFNKYALDSYTDLLLDALVFVLICWDEVKSPEVGLFILVGIDYISKELRSICISPSLFYFKRRFVYLIKFRGHCFLVTLVSECFYIIINKI